MLRLRLSALVLLVSTLAPANAGAQVQITSRALAIQFRGRIHFQFNTTSAGDSVTPDAEFEVRRARIAGLFDVTELLSGLIAMEFGQGDVQLIDAYIRLNFSPKLNVLAGQFKRPFDLFVLESSNRSLAIERVGDIRGVDGCSGVGSVCSLPRFTEVLGFSNRDIGLMAEGFLDLAKWKYSIALTNGSGGNVSNDNSAFSMYSRVSRGIGSVRIGGYIGAKDFVNEVTGEKEDYAWAGGADIQWGTYGQGLLLQMGAVVGENWRVLNSEGNGAFFHTIEAIAGYRTPIKAAKRMNSIQPVFRFSWGDPANSVDGDAGVLLTPGIIFNFHRLNRWAINVDVWSPSSGQTEWSLKTQFYLVF